MTHVTDTHSYDGLLPPLLEVPQMTLAECLVQIRAQCSDPFALEALKLIESGVGNYDESNKLDAADVLRAGWERIRDTEVRSVYFEQLADIVRSGSCPQGRTTRLIQFLF